MKIHTYLSSSGTDLIMEYINALTIEEQVDGLAVLAYMELSLIHISEPTRP